MVESNVGETGVDSIRIGRRRVGELSKLEQMRARKQIVLSDEERRVKDIRDRFPKYKVPNLRAGILEAGENIKRFEGGIQKERDTIAEFNGLLALCEQRDTELRAAGVEV